MSTIINVFARRIFNSRGEETVEVEVETEEGLGQASAPSGKSRGKYEVVPFPESGIIKALKVFKEIVKPKLIGLNAIDQKKIDSTLRIIDGTDNFSKIGGNTSYAISIACAAAAASSMKTPFFRYLLGNTAWVQLPLPLGNVLGGGKHAGKGTPDFQEYLSLPWACKTFSDAFSVNIKMHSEVGLTLEKKVSGFTGGKGDEGAWAPPVGNEEALEIVTSAAQKVSSETSLKIGIGLDVAASSLWNPSLQSYFYSKENRKANSGEQVDIITGLIRKYKLVYVEDPLHEDDFEGFTELTRKAKDCLICGDDLFVTNKLKLSEGIKRSAANALIIKPNQVGTLSDTIETVKLAKTSKYIPVISHRSGETTDSNLAHLAVGLGCPIIKTGVVGGERIAKLNELLRIEEGLQGKSCIASLQFH